MNFFRHIPAVAVLLIASIPTAKGADEAKAPAFRAQEIDGKIEIGYGLAIADVDGDGKKDILLADKKQIVWYQNPNWTKHVMAENLTELDNVCIAAADIDGDGKAEVAVGAGWNPGDTVNSGAVFYLEAPADRTAHWTLIELPKEPTVHRMKWIQLSPGVARLVMVPLHGRGNKGGVGDGVHIVSYEKPADVHQPWKTRVVDDSLHMTHNFQPVAWNAVPGDELLVASREGIYLMDHSKGSWAKTQVGGNNEGSTDFIGAGEVRNGQLSKSRRFLATVEPMHGNQACIYLEPEGAAAGKLWNRQVIETNLIDGHAVACGDLFHQGKDQVVVGSRGRKPGDAFGIKIYQCTDAEGQTWTSTTLDNGKMACEDLTLADLNNDGKLDIIASGRSTKNVMIYWNETGK